MAGVLTLFIAAQPNGGSVQVRLVDEDSGAVVSQPDTQRVWENGDWFAFV